MERLFSLCGLAEWCFSVLQAVIVFWFCLGYYKLQANLSDGKVMDLYAEGTTL